MGGASDIRREAQNQVQIIVAGGGEDVAQASRCGGTMNSTFPQYGEDTVEELMDYKV